MVRMVKMRKIRYVCAVDRQVMWKQRKNETKI